ncbi:MAG: choice-of-anchor D domain-containing protein [Burkholderiales bacterium]
MSLQRIITWRLTSTLVLASLITAAQAADPVAGKALYLTPNGAPLGCAASACHGADPTRDKSNILSGTSAARIQQAINNDKGGMGFLSAYVNATDLANIAAYIANPAAGAGAPVIALSTNALVFGNQVTGVSSQPMSATVSNTGSMGLSLSTISLSGTNASEFARSGTCAPGSTVAAGGNCTIIVTFTPQAAGARSAAVTLTHNATGGTSTINLGGTGALPQPAVSLSAQTIRFVAAQLLNTSSAINTVTLSNSGTSPLNFTSLALAGTNPGDFTRGGTCAVGTPVNPGATCTLGITFRPTVIGARSAQLVLSSNASGAPISISITGNGTTLVAPATELSVTSLALGNEIVGSPTAAQPVTVTNVGSATMNITSITASPADFTYQSACGASIAAGASCTLPVTFTPTAAGARSGTLSIATDAPGSPHVVSLSGVGYANGTLSNVTLSPSTLAFASQPVNTTSASQPVTLTNAGPVPIAITNFNLTGANFQDFTRTGGTCAANVQIAETGSCTMMFTFTPNATGARTATLGIASPDISSNPSVSLIGSAPFSGGSTATPSNAGGGGGGGGGSIATNVGAGGCAIGAPNDIDPLLILLALCAVAGLAFKRRMTAIQANR